MGDTSSKSTEYASSVDAALTAQPGLTAKIEQIKATGQLTPTLKPPIPADAKFIPPGDPVAAPKAAMVTPVVAAVVPPGQVVLASHDPPDAGQKPAAATEPKVEPKIEPKIEAKIEPKIEPKIDPIPEIKIPRSRP